MMWFPYGGAMGGGMWFLLALTWVAIAVIGYFVARRSTPPAQPQDPVAVLDMQLARGEIGLDDYKARREALKDTK
ncbi:hypothetical protein ACNI3K_05895 [Demequina sp. SO4-13]|uniref:hypothetical protein n=1 Tax=Demequina sp. SO4-13 TaxID=3401027 RepID=UPI003AF9AEB4